MKNLLARRKYARGIAAIGALAAVFAIAVSAGAQTGPSTVTAQQAIHDLKANYGIMIIPRDGVDLNTMVNTSLVGNQLGTPSQAVTRLADAMDARSRMVFIVVPATADRPVTTLADAQSFDSSGGTITLHLSGLPAQDAIQTVAAADNAAADIRSDVGSRTINLDGTDMSSAEAVAQIAAQTNTHWIQAYELTPPPATIVRAPLFHRSRPYTIMTEDEGPLGPVTFHPAPPPPPPAQPAPATADQGTNNPPANQANPAPANQDNSGYPPYFVMQNGYGWENGVPYPQTWSGFSNGGYLAGSGLYLTPGF